MDKAELRQYRLLLKEQELLKKKIESYEDKMNTLPDIYDKVQASSSEWPYVSVHIPVKAKDPELAAGLRKLIKLNEQRQQEVMASLVAIEEYINGIPDSEDRQIFEMVYISGKTYKETGEVLHIETSTVAKRIKKQIDNQNDEQE